MKRNLTLLTLVTAVAFPTLATTAEIDWKKVDAALGKTAAVSGEVHRYGIPRSDLHVTLDGVAIKPALALGGWVAFAPMHGEAMVMGDLVLLESEITPVMTKLLDGGLGKAQVSPTVANDAPADQAKFFFPAPDRLCRNLEYLADLFQSQHRFRCFFDRPGRQ